MWSFLRKKEALFFTNSLSKKKERFTPINSGKVLMYSCGPTVYDRQHIGNLASVVFADTLRRVTELAGYNVKQVINITDFGHLTSDADEGDDKMAKGLKREGLEFTLENMLDLGKRYAQVYFEDARALGVALSDITFPFASHYVSEQIVLISKLEKKGYAYSIPEDGIYFDTARFKEYGALGGVNTETHTESRIATLGKKSSADSALWKCNSELGWNSPWGQGFPGWHIECSAMIFATLGEQIDIHTGGPEHVAIHHNNEIAQSEAASGKSPFARVWLHREWVRIDNEKIAKSIGNTVYLSDVLEKRFHPLALRYLFLTAHYRMPTNFTWDALAATSEALIRLWRQADVVRRLANGKTAPSSLEKELRTALFDDLGTPQAIALLWKALGSIELTASQKLQILTTADKALGLSLLNPPAEFLPAAWSDLPEGIRVLVDDREKARQNGDFSRADALRAELSECGYHVEDSGTGPLLFPRA